MTPKKNTDQEQKAVKEEGLSAGLRLFIIALLSAVLLIPSFLIGFLIQDRDHRKNRVVREIAEQWSGGGQTIAAPVLTLPYRAYFKDARGNIQSHIQYAHFLPETLDISGRMVPEVRYRGIYRVALYNADLKINGQFRFPDMAALNLKESNVLWGDAFLTLGMTNTKSIQEKVVVQWNGKDSQAEPGVKCKDVVESGISVPVELNRAVDRYRFSFSLRHNGHDILEFIPLGKVTTIHLASSWGDPSFIGTFLPDQRTITAKGFEATWKVIDINRNFPQAWCGSAQSIFASAFGVSLFLPVDHYQKTTRTVKYAIMFIGLTFLALFMLDILGRADRRPIHPIQYLLIGMALVLFYTLLLSLSEHLGFAKAYLIASAAIIGLIALYTKSVLNHLRQTGLITGILTVLYAYLYIVLQLEDYALLIGSVSLFIILALMMYLTRKIDWADMGRQKTGKES